MTVIYEPRGKAREYSPLALNLYRGCDHGCSYCYVPAIFARQPEYDHSTVKPRTGIIEAVERDARKLTGSRYQVLLSFTGDPYCQADTQHQLTRHALDFLLAAKIPVAILSKGGSRSLRDLDIFRKFRRSIKVGATLTFISPVDSRRWEPGAASPGDRTNTLKLLHEAGIRTWASMEPIIDPGQTLELIRTTAPFVDQYKLGKWNHDPRSANIDWTGFLKKAIALLRSIARPFYVKECLRAHLGDIKLRPEEMDMDSLALPPFPVSRITAIRQSELILV